MPGLKGLLAERLDQAVEHGGEFAGFTDHSLPCIALDEAGLHADVVLGAEFAAGAPGMVQRRMLPRTLREFGWPRYAVLVAALVALTGQNPAYSTEPGP